MADPTISTTESRAEPLPNLEEVIVDWALGGDALRQLHSGAISRKKLTPIADEILRLSEQYTESERHEVPSLARPLSASAYALYYLPINVAKITHLFEEIPFSSTHSPLSILDFGSGPGTGAVAALSRFSNPLDVVCVERNEGMRRAAHEILGRFGKGRSLRSLAILPTLPETQKFDLIFACNVINELSAAKREESLQALLSRLSPGGILIVLEPGTFVAGREVMRLRDLLLSSNPDLSPLFPCTTRSPCPMVTSPGDWCHGTLTWKIPQTVRQLDEITGFNKHRLKYSALVLARNASLQKGYRVIIAPEKKKPGTMLTLCGENLYGVVTLPKRNRSDLNRPLDRALQFERVEISPPPENHIVSDACLVERPSRRSSTPESD